MFTGIVEEVGTITRVEDTGGALRVRIEAEQVPDGLAIGDSISVSGCCLTVVIKDPQGFEVELSKETLEKTASRWHAGARVNLERAMRADSRFGGHMVSGHVEAVGEVLEVQQAPGAYTMTLKATPTLARYLIPKGSITIDGVSLTVVDVGGPGGTRSDLPPHVFTLWLIPHTLEVTTLGDLKPGDRVNLEADLIAKHLERLMLLREKEASHVA